MAVSKHTIASLLILGWLFASGMSWCDQPVADVSGREGAVSLSFGPRGPDKSKFGTIADASFTLRNLSEKAIVVLRIKPIANHGEDPIALFGSAYGSVRWSEDEDVYLYNSLLQQATQLRFYAGFLLPGQEVSLVRGYRPVSRTEGFAVEYVSADAPYDGTCESLSPLVVYCPEKDAAAPWQGGGYRLFVESHWLDICNATPATGEVGPGVPRRAVLIPELSAEPAVQMIQVRVEFENEGFFGEDAARAAARIMGTEPEDAALAYSHSLGGYVVLEGDFS